MKKTVMNHSLAKALIEAGMHHYDDGGVVTANAPTGGGGPSTTASGDPGWLARLFGAQSGYEAKLAPTQTYNYGNVIGQAAGNALAGYGQAQNIQAQQQQLANALLAQSQGQGPNPAQAALAQATGQNVAQQAALMGSQRGASSNAGLIARQAAMQGGAAQQAAAGQSATLQAQQQIAAQQALAQQQAAMAQGNVAQQGLQAQLFGTGAQANQAQNQANIANYGMVQGINAQVSQGQGKGGGILGGIGGALAALHRGGEVKHMADGGFMDTLRNVGGVLSAFQTGMNPPAAGTAPISKPTGPGLISKIGGFFGAGYPASNKDEFGNVYSHPEDVPIDYGSLAKGGPIPEHLHKMASIYHPHFAHAVDFRDGGHVPGKAKVEGDSIENDTVPALLSPGEAVLPRSVAKAPDAPDKAAEFVRHLQEKESKQKGYEQIAKSKKSLKERVETLEKLYAGGRAHDSKAL